MKNLRQLWDEVKNSDGNDWEICLSNYLDDYNTFQAASEIIGKLLGRNPKQETLEDIKKIRDEFFDALEKNKADWLGEMNKLVNLKEQVVSIQKYTEFDILEWDYCHSLRKFVVKYKPKDYPVSCWNSSLEGVIVND